MRPTDMMWLSKRIKSRFRRRTVALFENVSPIAVVLLIGVMLGVVAVVKYFRIDGAEQTRMIRVHILGENWAQMYRQYEGFRPPYWFVDHIQSGQQAFDGKGREIARITDVELYPRSGADYDVYANITIHGYNDRSTQNYMFNGQPIIVGRQIKIVFSNIDLLGDIIDDNVADSERIQTKKNVEVIVEAMPVWQYNAIQVGATASNGGSIIAEVLSKSSRPTETVSVSEQNSQLKFRRNDMSVDATIRLRLVVEQHLGAWYYGGHQQVKVGNQLWIPLDATDISAALIAKVDDADF